MFPDYFRYFDYTKIPESIQTEKKSLGHTNSRHNAIGKNETFTKLYSTKAAFISQIKYYFKQMLLQQSLRKNGSVYGDCRYLKQFNKALNLMKTAYNKMAATNHGEVFYSFIHSTVI